MTVRTILHGGLGNQLFQLFFSQLLAQAVNAPKLSLVTARLGHYAVGRDMELAPLLAAGDARIAVSDEMTMVERWRLPKLVARAVQREIPLRWRGRQALVDGYFQSPATYLRFDDRAMAALLDRWRELLREQNLVEAPRLAHLTHARLTDFVASGQDPRMLAKPIIDAVPDHGAVMTDDEDTVAALLALRPAMGRPTLVPTEGLSSWGVLKAMTAYAAIDTNGSSLACWAALLTGARFASVNSDHVAFTRLCGHVSRAGASR